jgi:hypothetical protein
MDPAVTKGLFVSHGIDALNYSSREWCANLCCFSPSGMNPRGTRAKRTGPKYFAGMNRVLHSTTKSPRREKHQEKKPAKNSHKMGKRSISDRKTAT